MEKQRLSIEDIDIKGKRILTRFGIHRQTEDRQREIVMCAL